jgi:hypothetical protein
VGERAPVSVRLLSLAVTAGHYAVIDSPIMVPLNQILPRRHSQSPEAMSIRLDIDWGRGAKVHVQLESTIDTGSALLMVEPASDLHSRVAMKTTLLFHATAPDSVKDRLSGEREA